jgi:protein phosphatase
VHRRNEVKEFFSLTGKDEDATWPFKGAREKTYTTRTAPSPPYKLANARIIEMSEQDGDRKNMGTTAVMVHFVERNGAGATALVAHVGDSRAYLFRAGQPSASRRSLAGRGILGPADGHAPAPELSPREFRGRPHRERNQPQRINQSS